MGRLTNDNDQPILEAHPTSFLALLEFLAEVWDYIGQCCVGGSMVGMSGVVFWLRVWDQFGKDLRENMSNVLPDIVIGKKDHTPIVAHTKGDQQFGSQLKGKYEKRRIV